MPRRVKKIKPTPILDLMRRDRKPPVRPTQSIPSKKTRAATKRPRPTETDE